MLREEDLLQPPGERDVRTRRTRDGSEAFVRVWNFIVSIDRSEYVLVWDISEKVMKRREREYRAFTRKRGGKRGGEKTASVGKEEREGTKTNE